MVAETRGKPSLIPKRGKPLLIPILTKLKARNLYLVQGLSYRLISQETGLTVPCLEKLACRNGWTKLRKEALRKAEAKQDSCIGGASAEAIEAITSLAGASAIEGLGRVEQSLQDHGPYAAKDFQSWTGGVRNLVSVMRELSTAPAEQKTAGTTLNMFIMRAGDVAATTPVVPRGTEVNVTPVSTQALPVVAAPLQKA